MSESPSAAARGASPSHGRGAARPGEPPPDTATPGAPVPAYAPAAIEPKWQQRWEADRLYRAADEDPRPFYYFLTMLPYTSGDLHIGHWFAMAPADVGARWQRMQGKNVLFPMGFDAFGLPAENAAIKQGRHPKEWTYANIENMERQLRTLGGSFDWEREVATSDPEYYRWTQWWFLQLYKHGLAYRRRAAANWCPSCQTVLANEQVIRDANGVGRCERCDSVVEMRDLEQWFFRITNYVEELLDFSKIDWPERIEAMQTNWIGRSEGASIEFPLEQPAPATPTTSETTSIGVFTTRPDTVFGVTYLVLAPEHPLVEQVTTPEQREAVDAYVRQARLQTEIERQSTEREKTGVFTGAYVRHPFTDERLPVWIADYALASYGTGAVMGVPAHDERDFAFASKYRLGIPVVIRPPDWDGGTPAEAFVEPGPMINSGEFDGLVGDAAKRAVAEALAARGLGGPQVNYRIRDWLISRQRYWGAPIPMVYCDKCGIVPVPEDQLPVLLPDDAEFLPTGASPLERHEGFRNTTCPECGEPARRETDTMDTFMCSSWYMYRYVDPHNDESPIRKELARKWLPVDQYTGGAEHAVMHLLYSRFFAKAARDMGILPIDEPFTKLFNQGTITKDGHKMSKSRGNVVNPDDWVAKVGADTVRLYLMFLGPWDQGGDWDDSGIQGQARWLNRVWQLALTPVERAASAGSADREGSADNATEIRRLTHAMIAKVSGDIAAFRFNTMIAAMMEFTNALTRVRDAGAVDGAAWDEAIESLLLCLAPSAPHIAEELWERLGKPYSIHTTGWPSFDPELARSETVAVVVQVNGKFRERLDLPPGTAQAEAEAAARASEKVSAHLEGKSLRKMVFVPDKLLNFVVS